MDGQLGDKLFLDLLRDLSAESASGLLRLSRPGETKYICFESGVPVFAISSRPADHLETRLLDNGVIDPEQLTSARAVSTAESRPVEKVLMELGLVSRQAVQQSMLDLSSAIIQSAFEWRAGAYKFTRQHNTQYEFKLSWSAAECLLAGIRYSSFKDEMLDLVAPDDQTVQPSQTRIDLAAQSAALNPTEGYVFSCLQQPTPISDISLMTGLPHADTRRAAFVLLQLGLLEYQGCKPAARPAPQFGAAAQPDAASATAGSAAPNRTSTIPSPLPADASSAEKARAVGATADRDAADTAASYPATTEDLWHPSANVEFEWNAGQQSGEWSAADPGSVWNEGQSQLPAGAAIGINLAGGEGAGFLGGSGFAVESSFASEPPPEGVPAAPPISPSPSSTAAPPTFEPPPIAQVPAPEPDWRREPRYASEPTFTPPAAPMRPPETKAPGMVMDEIDSRLRRAKSGDLYDAIGVDKLASNETINREYARLKKLCDDYSSRWLEDDELHSKLNALRDASERAFATLGDVEKRRRYDMPASARSAVQGPPRRRESGPLLEPIRRPQPPAETEGPPARPGTPTGGASGLPADPPQPGQSASKNPFAAAEQYYRQARAYFDRSDVHTSVHLLKQAVNLDPGRSSYHFLLGQALLIQSQARIAHEHHQGCHVTCKMGGSLSRNQRVRHEAETHLLKAAELDPSNARVRIKLASLYREDNRMDRAQQCLKEAAAIDPMLGVAIEGITSSDESANQDKRSFDDLLKTWMKK